MCEDPYGHKVDLTRNWLSFGGNNCLRQLDAHLEHDIGDELFLHKGGTQQLAQTLENWRQQHGSSRQGALKTYLKTCMQQGHEQMFCDYFSPWPMYGEETIQAPLQNELHALQENMNYVCAYNLFIFVETKFVQVQAFNQEVHKVHFRSLHTEEGLIQ